MKPPGVLQIFRLEIGHPSQEQLEGDALAAFPEPGTWTKQGQRSSAPSCHPPGGAMSSAFI